MYPILLSIGSFKLYTYGFFIAVGFLAAMWISKRLARPQNIAPQTITDVYFVIMLSAIAGARALYVFISFDAYKNNLFDIFKIWNGGLVFFGGFCAAILCSIVYIKKRNLPLWTIADIIAPGVALGHAFGRIGCFFAGCCYGKVCDLPFAVQYSHPESLAPLGVLLHPTQIYSVISNLILFFILLALHKKKKFDGQVFLIYIMLYSFFRSIIEFFRGDFRGDFFFDFISLSQGIGLSVSIVACFLLIKLSLNRSNHGTN
ncbi:MAG: prolipoprotein diacylglyceryl transferase [Desulfobacula sp.]|nr:prolipoprotein diacylglyceryl transferase [Desulfobacula sp.]